MLPNSRIHRSPCLCQCCVQCGSDGFPVAVPANSSAGSSQGAAKSTCSQPWQEGVLCCNKYQAAAWQTPVFTALHRDSRWQIWCFPLLGDAVFNYTVSCRGHVALSSLCTLQSNSLLGGWGIQAHCSWACQPGAEDGNLSDFCNFWETGNLVDWRKNPIAGLSKHHLCTGRLARKSLPPIYSWKSSQVFNIALDFWVMNRECKENSM